MSRKVAKVLWGFYNFPSNSRYLLFLRTAKDQPRYDNSRANLPKDIWYHLKHVKETRATYICALTLDRYTCFDDTWIF